VKKHTSNDFLDEDQQRALRMQGEFLATIHKTEQTSEEKPKKKEG